MIPPPFRYLKAASVDDAVSLLSGTPGSAVLAGGQTVINALKLDLVAPTALVDVHRLPELREIEETGDTLRIGAAVTYAELAADPVVALRVPRLAAVAGDLVDRQVRNRGTIGGNCCLNDPTSNLPPLLAAAGATFELRSPGAQTTMLPAEEFFVDSLCTRAQGANLLVAIHVPVTGQESHIAYRHQQVAADSWALARAVVRVDTDAAGAVDDARVFLGAVPAAPVRLPAVEDAVLGTDLGTATIARALAAFDGSEVRTVGDSHGSAAYRLAMSRVQLERALEDVRSRIGANKEVA